MLTSIEYSRYQAQGYLSPIAVLSESQAKQYRQLWESLTQKHGGKPSLILKYKPHLLVPQLWDLVMHPNIIETIKPILGENILCFGSSMITKFPQDGKHVSWHQDATHWGLQNHQALTVWLALSISNTTNGCVQVIPGTHSKVLSHDHPHDPQNLLGRQEVVRYTIDPGQVVDLSLNPGDASIHHCLLIHGSTHNQSNCTRMGFAIRYISATNGQTGTRRGTATLVCGDPGQDYELEVKPESLMARNAMLRHRKVLELGKKIICHDLYGES